MKNEPKEDVGFFRASKSDFLLIGLILFLSGFFIIWFAQGAFQPDSASNIAFIYQGKTLIEQTDLSKDRIIGILNGKMQLQIKAGKLRILNSDCPQHICKNMGWIKYGGQTIVCVPNQVLVEIKSKGPAVVDAVTY